MTQTTQAEAGEKYADNLYYLARAQAGDEAATAHLMEANAGLVRGVAARFRGRGAEFDDLVQIGSIGMLKAIRSFDVTRGTAFSTYAVPLIFGEIRRFLRDDGPIKVGRRQKQLGAALLSARQRLLRHLSHTAGKTVFLSTHDLELALQIADTVWLLTADNQLHVGTPRELAANGMLGRFVAQKGIVFDTERLSVVVESDPTC